MLVDDLLSLAAQHEADELAHTRIERPARRLVHIDVRVTAQGIAAVADIRRGQGNRRSIRRRGDGENLDVGVRLALAPVGVHAGPIYVHQRAPTDGVFVLADGLVHALAPDLLAVAIRGCLLLLDDFLEVRIPFVRPVHHMALEAHREARRDVAVRLDRLARPTALEAELTPRADVARGVARVFRREEDRMLRAAHHPGAAALRAEDLIELLHRQVGQRIVLVHHDGPGIEAAALVVAAGRHRDLGGRIAESVIEGHLVGDLGIITHRGDVRYTGVDHAERALAFSLEVRGHDRLGLDFLEARDQRGNQALERAAGDAQAAHDVSLRLVRRHLAQVRLLRAGERRQCEAGDGQREPGGPAATGGGCAACGPAGPAGCRLKTLTHGFPLFSGRSARTPRRPVLIASSLCRRLRSRSRSQAETTIAPTPLPIMLVSARASLMKRSMPRISARPATGTEGRTDSVAARVTNPAPVTPAAPLEVSMATARKVSSCTSVRWTLSACAMKTTASVI